RSRRPVGVRLAQCTARRAQIVNLAAPAPSFEGSGPEGDSPGDVDCRAWWCLTPRLRRGGSLAVESARLTGHARAVWFVLVLSFGGRRGTTGASRNGRSTMRSVLVLTAAVLATAAAGQAATTTRTAAVAGPSCKRPEIGVQGPFTGPVASVGVDQLHWAQFEL